MTAYGPGLPRTRTIHPAFLDEGGPVTIWKIVDGERRETLECDCGELMIAGVDHTCSRDRYERYRYARHRPYRRAGRA